jgi:hypothetical protein
LSFRRTLAVIRTREATADLLIHQKAGKSGRAQTRTFQSMRPCGPGLEFLSGVTLNSFRATIAEEGAR